MPPIRLILFPTLLTIHARRLHSTLDPRSSFLHLPILSSQVAFVAQDHPNF